MRYLKVFLAVVFFFVVMLFFEQNQDALSRTMTLRMDPLFMPPVESGPLSYYTLALIAFLLGGLVALLMLIWERMSVSTQLGSAKRRIKQLEKELEKSGESLEAAKAEAREAVARAEALEKGRFSPVFSSDSVSFTTDLRQE